MKKIDNFSSCLTVLKSADFSRCTDDEIYRTGVIGQFNLTFELAWKALQAVMREHSVAGSDTGSPRDILKLGYKSGFISDADVWILMLKKRNSSVHIYDEDETDELVLLIRDSFIPAFSALETTLIEKEKEAQSESWD